MCFLIKAVHPKKGRQTHAVYNATGQRVLSLPIEHLGGNATQSIQLGSRLAAGLQSVAGQGIGADRGGGKVGCSQNLTDFKTL